MNKYKYGEVFTPKVLVMEMWQLFKERIYNENITSLSPLNIFEPGAGHGIFYDTFFDIFDKSDYEQYTMNEINEENSGKFLIEVIEKHNYCQKDDVLFKNFFNLNNYELKDGGYDLVVGNLPFHVNGMKQVPSASYDLDKHKAGSFDGEYKEGKTIWTDMVHRLVNGCIRENGYGMIIIPLIWLKPDRTKVYHLLTHRCTILYLKTYTSTEANKLFGYNAQTPLCYVIFRKREIQQSKYTIKVFDRDVNDFVSFHFYKGQDLCIPTNNASLVQKMIQYRGSIKKMRQGSLAESLIKVCHMNKDVLKGRLNGEGIVCINPSDENNMKIVREKREKESTYFVITGAQLPERHGDVSKCLLKGFFSKTYGSHYGVRKVILPHKRFAFSVIDDEGIFSLYGRDKYVFCFGEGDEEREKMINLHTYLSLDIIQKMVDSFKVRMSFIEKYIFDYIPMVDHVDDFIKDFK